MHVYSSKAQTHHAGIWDSPPCITVIRGHRLWNSGVVVYHMMHCHWRDWRHWCRDFHHMHFFMHRLFQLLHLRPGGTPESVSLAAKCLAVNSKDENSFRSWAFKLNLCDFRHFRFHILGHHVYHALTPFVSRNPPFWDQSINYANLANRWYNQSSPSLASVFQCIHKTVLKESKPPVTATMVMVTAPFLQPALVVSVAWLPTNPTCSKDCQGWYIL